MECEKNRNIRMIGLDLDGTVFNDEKKITAHTKEVLAAAIRRGIVVLPATGRPQSGLPEEFLEIPGVRYAVTSNGGRIVDLESGEAVYECRMPWELTQQVIRQVRDVPGSVWEVYCDGKCLVEKEEYRYIEHPLMPQALKDYIRKSRIYVPKLTEKLRENRAGAEKMHMLFERTEDRDGTLELLRQNQDLQVSIAAPFNLEINYARAGKGKGLLELGRLLGIRREEIMACGDSWNDWTMLKSVGFPVVMGNADPETKKLGAFITRSNEEDGAAYAIEKFILH